MAVTVQFINTGSSANAGNGDSLRTAFNKINANFAVLSTSTGFILEPATANTLGGVKIGVGIVASPDGTISATGSSAGTEINVLDQTSAPSVDIVSYSGSTVLTLGTPQLFTFDKSVYRSAIIDISARNTALNTDDIASGYSVTWAGNLATIVGFGPIAMGSDGVTGNAQWDLSASCLGSNVLIEMKNPAGNVAVGHTINWRAKVSLFRL